MAASDILNVLPEGIMFPIRLLKSLMLPLFMLSLLLLSFVFEPAKKKLQGFMKDSMKDTGFKEEDYVNTIYRYGYAIDIKIWFCY